MTAAERIQVIKQSIRVFIYGLLGLVPFLGIPFGLYAALRGAYVYTRHRHDWNPAATYLNWGMTLGIAGAMVWFFIAAIAAIQLL